MTEHTGIDFSTVTDEEARRQAAIRGLEVASDTRFDILPVFFEEYVEEELIQPTFVLDILRSFHPFQEEQGEPGHHGQVCLRLINGIYERFQ